MCQVANIKHKIITGFVKDDNFKTGDYFDKKSSSLESWVAVYVENDWRLVDPLLGGGKFYNSELKLRNYLRIYLSEGG